MFCNFRQVKCNLFVCAVIAAAVHCLSAPQTAVRCEHVQGGLRLRSLLQQELVWCRYMHMYIYAVMNLQVGLDLRDCRNTSRLQAL